MQNKFKTWIFDNFHLIFSVSVLSLLFYLSLLGEWSLTLLFIIFFILNFYFIHGIGKLFLSTLLAPLPFFLLPSLFQVNNLFTTTVWTIALVLLWRREQLFWLFYIFFILLVSHIALGNFTVSPFLIISADILIFLFVLVSTNKELPIHALIKSLIVAELLWLFFFLPFHPIIRAIVTFIAYYQILHYRVTMV